MEKILFNDARQEIEIETPREEYYEILQSEVIKVIKSASPRKAIGPDEIHGEILQLLNAESLSKLTKLFNEIYASGEIPHEWLKSTFITLPKKASASKCDEYRMISLMSHLLKAFLRIVHDSIRGKCEINLAKNQFGFRK